MNDYEKLIKQLRCGTCADNVPLSMSKAANAIEQLTKERDEFHDVSLFQAEEIGHMLGSINKLRIERDAAVADLKQIVGCYSPCDICGHKFAENAAEYCIDCGVLSCYDHFEWRGVQG